MPLRTMKTEAQMSVRARKTPVSTRAVDLPGVRTVPKGLIHLKAIPPTHREIALLAFHLFEERGRKHGFHVEDWLAAEAHLCTDEKHCFEIIE